MESKNKDLLELVDLIIDGVNSGVQAVKNGKDVISDAPLLMQLIKDAGPAFDNIGAVPAELSHMDADGAAEVIARVASKLQLGDEHAKLVAETVLKTAYTVYELVKVLQNKPAQA
jgi:hypothetical protein